MITFLLVAKIFLRNYVLPSPTPARLFLTEKKMKYFERDSTLEVAQILLCLSIELMNSNQRKKNFKIESCVF